MEIKLDELLAGLPEKPPRSCLEAFRDFIHELRRRKRTYREIAQILEKKCQLRVSKSTVHRFLRSRPHQRRKSPKRSVKPIDTLQLESISLGYRHRLKRRMKFASALSNLRGDPLWRNRSPKNFSLTGKNLYISCPRMKRMGQWTDKIPRYPDLYLLIVKPRSRWAFPFANTAAVVGVSCLGCSVRTRAGSASTAVSSESV
jgi:hypothetical protein